jgi:DMSO/TMAO reductase YedYZ molybdopterin-dependent catalytic subunit
MDSVSVLASRKGMPATGLPVASLLKLKPAERRSVVKPLPSAKFVLFKSFDDYTTNLPLEACDDQDVLLTYKWNGRPLTKEHGGPVRMIIPKRYAWKGAKWVKEITFSDKDAKGFWEVRGYSNSGFPWENDRYG